MEMEGNNLFGEVVGMNALKSMLSSPTTYLTTLMGVAQQRMTRKWSSQVSKKS